MYHSEFFIGIAIHAQIGQRLAAGSGFRRIPEWPARTSAQPGKIVREFQIALFLDGTPVCLRVLIQLDYYQA